MADGQTIERRVDRLETQFETFLREMREFKQEMRDRDNQRAEDIRELRQKQDAAQTRHAEEMREMNQRFYDKVDRLSEQINSTWRQTMLGVGGIIVAVGALLFAALK